MREKTGASSASAATALRGAGKAYINIDLSELRDDQAASEAAAVTAALSAAIGVGAIKGGHSFTITPVTFEAGFDGLGPNDKENIVYDEDEVMLSFSMSELVKNSLAQVLKNTTQTDIGNGFTEIKPDVTDCVPGFITNIALVFDAMDCAQDVPTILVVNNAYNQGGFSVQTASKQINSFDVEFKGHYAQSGEATPWSIFIPTPA